MKAEEQKALETNVLADRLVHLAEKTKSGQLLSFRWVALTIILVVAGGLWMYLGRETEKANSMAWQTVDGMVSAEQLKTFASEHPNTLQGRVASLQEARVLVGPEGIEQLRMPEKRKQAIENIETARTRFKSLSQEFQNDLTLKAQCIDGLAHAELSLVGIPDEKNAGKDRGDISKASDYFMELGKLLGESTELGKQMIEKAKNLEAKKQEVLQVAKDLNNRLSPNLTSPDLKLPDSLMPKLDKPAGAGIKSPDLSPPAPPTPPKADDKAAPKADDKAAPKTETKAEPKAEPKKP